MFSIIIPTCNRVNELVKCLDALIKCKNFDCLCLEIIISDDSKSLDCSSFILSKYSKTSLIKYIYGPSRGPAANRNSAAKHAQGDWLIFLDDDCLPSADLIESYYYAVQKFTNCKVFEGAILPLGERKAMDEEAPINTGGGKLWSCNFCIRRDLFLQIEGFDDCFPFAAMEDVELNYRLQKSGFSIAFIKEAYVEHPWKVKGKPHRVVMNHFESTLYFVSKYPELTSRFSRLYYVRAFFRMTLSFIKHIFVFRGKGAINRLSYIFTHLYIILFKRMKFSGFSEVNS